MKKSILSLLLVALAANPAGAANDVLHILHNGIHEYAPLTQIDSLWFSADGATMYVLAKDSVNPVSLTRSDISTMNYLPSADCPTELDITFASSSATVQNPYFLDGVSVTVDGAYVTVDNTNVSTEITTSLSGSTTNGSYIYNGTYKTTLELNGVSITSQNGAAIDIECGKRVDLLIKKSTVNTLVDAANGEQKAALYCKGHLEIDKAGTLNVTGKTAHAISAKEYIKMKKSEGIINVLGAVKDGIHCKQYYLGNGFTINISNVGDDNIQCELDGEENDEGIVDGTIIINDGTYTLKNSTNGWMEDSESCTAKGLNADGNLQLIGGTISIAMTGTGGKGIRVEGTYIQGTEDGAGPTLTVSTTGSAYTGTTSSSSTGGNNRPGGGGGGWGGGSSSSTSSADAKAIKVLGAVTIYGGTTYVTTSTDGAEGLESKTSIAIKGGTHYFKCYDDCINSSGIISFAGGNTVCYGYGNDAVDSNYGKSGAIALCGGNLFAYSTKGSPEEGIDADNNSYLTISGGIVVSAGGQQGGGGGGWGSSSSSSSSVGSSSQGYYLGSSPSSYNTSYYYTLCNTSGTAICTYKFEASCSNSLGLLTASTLGKGSVTVKYGTSAPTACTSKVCNASGTPVFWVAPTVTTSGTSATVTAK